jgi:parvulin-like peptidyl-prolyl isomerase
VIPRNAHRLLALALLAAVFLAACGSDGGGGGGTSSPAATVDGTSFTDAQVAQNVKIVTFHGDLNQNACGSAHVAGESVAAACARFAVGSLIQEHFVNGYAADHSITVTQADADSIISQLEQSLGSAQALDTKLKSAGITRTDLNDLAHRILLFQAVQKDVAAKGADDATLKKLYQDNILQFTTLDTEHILVKTEAEANKIYGEVTAPGFTEKDFLALAKKDSTDPTVTQNSGALGPIPASQLEQPFAEAAMALKPGEISKPVQSSFGWHVIRLVSTKVQSFADARATLLQQQGVQVFDDWLKKAVLAADIKVNPKYGTFNPETQSVDAVTSTATGSPSSSASGSQVPASATPTSSP